MPASRQNRAKIPTWAMRRLMAHITTGQLDAFKKILTPLQQAAVAAEMVLNLDALYKIPDFVERTTLLVYATLCGREEIVTYLLEHGAGHDAANETGCTALFVASQEGHASIVAMLLKIEGIGVNAVNNYKATPLFIAAHFNHPACISLLLKAGADSAIPAHDGFGAIHTAAMNGYTEAVKALQKGGASIDLPVTRANKTAKEATALHLAVVENHVDVIRLLVESGANIEAHTRFSRTPLFIAALSGQLEAAMALVDCGAVVDAPARNKKTPLYIAAHMGELHLVKFLLAVGADIEGNPAAKTTPLLAAASEEKEEVVECLLKIGANPVPALTVKTTDKIRSLLKAKVAEKKAEFATLKKFDNEKSKYLRQFSVIKKDLAKRLGFYLSSLNTRRDPMNETTAKTLRTVLETMNDPGVLLKRLSEDASKMRLQHPGISSHTSTFYSILSHYQTQLEMYQAKKSSITLQCEGPQSEPSSSHAASASSSSSSTASVQISSSDDEITQGLLSPNPGGYAPRSLHVSYYDASTSSSASSSTEPSFFGNGRYAGNDNASAPLTLKELHTKL